MQPVLGFDIDGSTAGLQVVTGNNLAGTGNNFLFAGDADGDGIADSLPQRLPVGKLNGVTYYAYVRIIDHASAINVNTAMSRDFDYTGDLNQTLVTSGVADKTLWKYGFFSTDIGIAEMLRDYTQPMTPPATPTNMGANFQELLEYRANNVTPSGVAATTPAGTPVSDSGNRPDFLWLSWGDAFHHQHVSAALISLKHHPWHPSSSSPTHWAAARSKTSSPPACCPIPRAPPVRCRMQPMTRERGSRDISCTRAKTSQPPRPPPRPGHSCRVVRCW
jgi:hypothetical protein